MLIFFICNSSSWASYPFGSYWYHFSNKIETRRRSIQSFCPDSFWTPGSRSYALFSFYWLVDFALIVIDHMTNNLPPQTPKWTEKRATSYHQNYFPKFPGYLSRLKKIIFTPKHFNFVSLQGLWFYDSGRRHSLQNQRNEGKKHFNFKAFKEIVFQTFLLFVTTKINTKKLDRKCESKK